MENEKLIPVRALSAPSGDSASDGKHLINTNPDNPDDAPPIDPDADARYWPVDNPTNPDNVVPYRGEVQDQFGNKDNRAAVVDPYGRTYPAENQDKYGNPDYGTTGGWNSDFSGQGNNGGGYSNFCCTGAA